VAGHGSFNGQPDYESDRNDLKKQLHGGERNRLHFDQCCWRPEPLHNHKRPRRTGLTNVVVADGAVPRQVLCPRDVGCCLNKVGARHAGIMECPEHVPPN